MYAFLHTEECPFGSDIHTDITFQIKVANIFKQPWYSLQLEIVFLEMSNSCGMFGSFMTFNLLHRFISQLFYVNMAYRYLDMYIFKWRLLGSHGLDHHATIELIQWSVFSHSLGITR